MHFRRRFLAICLAGLCMFSCSSTPEGSLAGVVGGTTETVAAKEVDPPGLAVTSPSGAPTFTTNLSPLTLAGVATTDVTVINWSVGGVQGQVSGTQNWQGDIPLQAGDNSLTLTAQSPNGTATRNVTITLNPSFSFRSPLAAEPEYLFVNETTPVTFTATTENNPGLNKASVRLIEVAGDGTALSDVGSLADNNDFRFTAQFTLQANQVGHRYYRVTATVAGQTVRSEVVDIPVIAHLTAQEKQMLLTIPDQADEVYQAELQRSGSHPLAQQVTVSYLHSLPDIRRAEASGGYGVWFTFQNGMLGLISEAPSGLKGGSWPAGHSYRRSSRPRRIAPKRILPNRLNRQQSNGTIIPDKQKALVVACYSSTLGTGEAELIQEYLSSSTPTKFPATLVEQGQVDLNTFRNWDQFGVIYLSTHGCFFGDREEAAKNGWTYGGRQVMISTGLTATSMDDPRIQAGCRLNHIGWSDDKTGRVWLMPSFFEAAYAHHRLPSSLVSFSACFSTVNDSMYLALAGAGAKTFTGYSDATYVDVTQPTGTNFYISLTNPDPADKHVRTTGESFHTYIQPKAPQGTADSIFQMRGATNLVLGEIPDTLLGSAYGYAKYTLSPGGINTEEEAGWIVPVPTGNDVVRVDVHIHNWRDPVTGQTERFYSFQPGDPTYTLPRIGDSLPPFSSPDQVEQAMTLTNNAGLSEGDSVYKIPWTAVYSGGPRFPDTQPPSLDGLLYRVSPSTVDVTVVRH